ncbi:MAG: bile acid:sodium symporter family protein [Cyanobacteriota bacterium]|jgi:BASS family bile acid:Na+ symporter
MTPAQLVGLLVKGSIFLTVFSLGLESSFRDLTGLVRKPQQLVRAIAPIYLVMPLVAGLLIALFSHVHPAVKIALFALSVSPIPPLLPKKQLKAGATASYVIGLLVAMSLLAIVFVPLLIEIFDRAFPQSVTILPATVAEIVLKVILLPLVLGVMTHYALPKVAGKAATILSRVGNILLLLGVLVILVKSLPSILSLIGNGTVLVAVLFVVIGLVVGHLFGGPDPDDRAALAVSTVSRHPGMALAIAGVNFPEQKLSFAAIALYLLLNTAITAIYLKKIRKLLDGAGSGSAI